MHSPCAWHGVFTFQYATTTLTYRHMYRNVSDIVFAIDNIHHHDMGTSYLSYGFQLTGTQLNDAILEMHAAEKYRQV